MRTKFAENFSDVLRIRNISQSQFARLYGVKPNTINQWANGKREPTYHDLICICILLDVDIKEMLGCTPKTREHILYEIIAGNEHFQKRQKELQTQLFKEGKNSMEVLQACEQLYKETYHEYKEIFKLSD